MSERPHPLALYHYTCEHGHDRIGQAGELLPAWDLVSPAKQKLLPVTSKLVWMTDLRLPAMGPLGLTHQMLTCDRTAHRYRVAEKAHALWWMDVRRSMPAEWRDPLELAPGAMPMHWWVTDRPVPVTYDPIPAGFLARR